ncbi:hypothetical protein FQA39_LY19310, partial [Lamprigera yunnana]
IWYSDSDCWRDNPHFVLSLFAVCGPKLRFSTHTTDNSWDNCVYRRFFRLLRRCQREPLYDYH